MDIYYFYFLCITASYFKNKIKGLLFKSHYLFYFCLQI